MWLESAHGTHIECAVLFAELCEGIVEIHAKSARKQMFITGVPELLERNPLYKSLLKLIESF